MAKIISDIKLSVLSDAMSAITILEVDHKKNLEGTYFIYIKTNDLNTVDLPLLDKMAANNSTKEFKVTYLIPETKLIREEHKNEDTVCISIEKVS